MIYSNCELFAFAYDQGSQYTSPPGTEPLTTAEPNAFPLAMADPEQRLRVVGLRAGRNLDRRLTDLGLNLGTELCVVQRRGGGLVVRRGETRFALGAGMAMKILVVPL